ncbi:MarC family protein [Snodgrassella sp. CFCC 13594]|uniref:MarC family protein n=1 Tax=Snodgrassella sp. CFCC 13594 TaxID=1775559 RepID=UPI0008324956|nr:MarC family protein [Snodgrassella sp. CFCC 13594]
MSFEVTKILLAFLVLINPLAALSLYLDLTADLSGRERRRVAKICSMSVFVIMVVVTLTGQLILRALGISIGAFQIAGGVLVFLISLSLIGGNANPAKPEVSKQASDLNINKPSDLTSIAVVPLAMPMIIGPGGISTVMIYASSSKGYLHTLAILAATLIISLICYFTLCAAATVSQVLGETGMKILNRVMGLLLAAIAVEIIVAGIKTLFPHIG